MSTSIPDTDGDTPLAAGIAGAANAAAEIILGKDQAIRLALACLLARGHLLIEDIPGVGKTTLAQALAQVLGLEFRRIQFTSDLMPADILGGAVYDRDRGCFEFHPGPVFTQVVFADEVNRATPKTQSALLEAMEERQVTHDGISRALPEPFFVVATQNPLDQAGTFPLPESQLDRFLMRISLGYPDRAAERALLTGRDRRAMLASLPASIEPERLLAMQSDVITVHVSEALLDYLQALVGHTRSNPEIRHGLSPRAGLGLLRAAQAWAYLHARDHVLPEDIQVVLPAVVDHRLHPLTEARDAYPGSVAARLAESVPIP